MICIWTMVFATGCGVSRNQNDVTENVHVSQDNEAVDSDNKTADSDNDADIVTGTQANSGTDSVIVPEEQESAPAPVLQEDELITDEATLQAVLDIVENSADQTVIEYADFTAEEFLAEVAAVYQTAHDNGYTYGDSQTMPPCEDGFISCDRLIARALWNLGMTDQPAKGMNVGNEALYLTTHGFELVTDQSQLSPGDIVMQDNGVSGIPTGDGTRSYSFPMTLRPQCVRNMTAVILLRKAKTEFPRSSRLCVRLRIMAVRGGSSAVST
jgi:hypothetical protein